MNKHLELFTGSTTPTPSANAGYPWVGANEKGSVVYKKQA
jgi:hypothetical protein